MSIFSVYLNSAATSFPKAPGVPEAVAEALTNSPSGDRQTCDCVDQVDNCRKLVASLLHVKNPNNIVFTSGATHGLNLMIHSLLSHGIKKVITSEAEHNSVLRPLNANNYGFMSTSFIRLNKHNDLDENHFYLAIKNLKPKLLILNHASNVTGRIFDVKKFFDIAKNHDIITLLDASQTVGHIPVIPKILNADIVAATGHKGLLGPQGTGILYISPSVSKIEPIFSGGTGGIDESANIPEEMPKRFEIGTQNSPGIIGLATALNWLRKNSESYLTNEESIKNYLFKSLRSLSKVHILDDVRDVPRLGTASFVIHGFSPQEIGTFLGKKHNIICRTGMHCAPKIHSRLGCDSNGSVRFSTSGFNTTDDVDRAIHALSKL